MFRDSAFKDRETNAECVFPALASALRCVAGIHGAERVGRVCREGLSLCLITVMGTGMLAGQNAADAIDPISQEGAQVAVTPVAVFGARNGPGMLGGIHTIEKFDGRYLVSSGGESDLIKVFSADGRYLRTVGRRGAGPGEYGYIRFLRSAEHTLHVFDVAPRRRTILTPELQVAGTSPIGAAQLGWDVAVLSDSLAVLNAMLFTSERIGYTLHAMDARGEIVESFGEHPEGYRRELGDSPYFRILAPAVAGGVWSLHWTRYQMDRWSAEGTLHQSIRREVSWFPEHPVPGVTMNDLQGRLLPRALWPRAVSAREDAEGRLWVALRAPDPEWPSNATVQEGPEGQRVAFDDPYDVFDGIIEVWDPDSGSVLASARFDQPFLRFVGEDEIASVSSDASGISTVRIWRVSVVPPETGRHE